jgi:hypothetical protein
VSIAAQSFEVFIYKYQSRLEIAVVEMLGNCVGWRIPERRQPDNESCLGGTALAIMNLVIDGSYER